MQLKEISKELSKLAFIEMDGYIKRGQLIVKAKQHFEGSTAAWLAWSQSHLGISKSTHYSYIRIYECFNDGTFGKEMKTVSLRVLYDLSKDDKLRNKARLAMRQGDVIDINWLKNQQKSGD
ncbi:hypothetical protein [Vibrio superstes]|uniref:Uncharacterized protein n=1 Tax=Vibrio superstes NBRC 103154 TaxID=1219062 RepID=A0A511QVN6_9VIBR|nr:hypothetical protein [Vibrio superstes]GEM81429.1 hypothetical protein VSU01S_36740 [Vibrio superstes NBRC 103154]